MCLAGFQVDTNILSLWTHFQVYAPRVPKVPPVFAKSCRWSWVLPPPIHSP